MISHDHTLHRGFMRTTVKGTLRNEPKPPSNLHPIFEAISNGIHAIEDKGLNFLEDYVEVTCIYEETNNQALEVIGDKAPTLVKSIKIYDTGIGFDNKNYNSFQELNSLHKYSRGGRGKGRFSWLKIFEYASINSTYKEADGFFERSFEFSTLHDPEGIGKIINQPSINKKSGTLITLKDPTSKLTINIENFLYRTIFHFLPQFINKTIPKLVIKSSFISYDLNHEFNKITYDNEKKNTFKIYENEFTVKHFLIKRISTHNTKHKVYFCADKREVKAEELDVFLPHLSTSLIKDGELYCYHAIIESDFLDKNVSSDRSRFNISDDKDCIEPSFVDILEQVKYFSSEYLSDWINPEKERSFNKIRDFIIHEAPYYRVLLKKCRHELDNLNANNISEYELEKKLGELKAKIELENRGNYKRFSDITSKEFGLERIETRYQQLLENLDDSAKDGLASYIVNRKKIISIFESLLKANQQGKFSKEVSLHGLIFPIKKDSDDVPFKDHNLWLIDEKLVFHQYLASDKPLNQYDSIETDSVDRPDLTIYQNAFGFSDEGFDNSRNSLSIIEFKRPGRDDYTDADNPIDQVISYAKQIRESKCKDYYSRELKVKENTLIYCYIICDITRTLRDLLDKRNYTPFPDEDGYYYYHDRLKIYIEVKSLNKLLREANQRHKAFFNELQLS